MRDLRNQLIRLAYTKPALRKDLLPLLRSASGSMSPSEVVTLIDKLLKKHKLDPKKSGTLAQTAYRLENMKETLSDQNSTPEKKASTYLKQYNYFIGDCRVFLESLEGLFDVAVSVVDEAAKNPHRVSSSLERKLDTAIDNVASIDAEDYGSIRAELCGPERFLISNCADIMEELRKPDPDAEYDANDWSLEHPDEPLPAHILKDLQFDEDTARAALLAAHHAKKETEAIILEIRGALPESIS